MIDRDGDTTALSIVRQCALLGLSRSSLYYRPPPIADADLRLMRRLDELHLTHLFLGARRLARLLQREGVDVGRRHVGTLMGLMGIEAIYRKKRTSLPAKGHRIYPYLLRDVVIERPNQVWATDVTYLPMAQGFAYLVAILDLYSRKVLAFRVSTTLAPDFCIEALGEALRRHGAPEIFNTDQGSQFHRRRLHRGAGRPGRTHQHGRQGALDRQCVRRAPVAEREVREHLPPRLRDARGGARRAGALLRVLQCPPAASEPRLSNTERDLLRDTSAERGRGVG